MKDWISRGVARISLVLFLGLLGLTAGTVVNRTFTPTDVLGKAKDCEEDICVPSGNAYVCDWGTIQRDCDVSSNGCLQTPCSS